MHNQWKFYEKPLLIFGDIEQENIYIHLITGHDSRYWQLVGLPSDRPLKNTRPWKKKKIDIAQSNNSAFIFCNQLYDEQKDAFQKLKIFYWPIVQGPAPYWYQINVLLFITIFVQLLFEKSLHFLRYTGWKFSFQSMFSSYPTNDHEIFTEIRFSCIVNVQWLISQNSFPMNTFK